MSRNDRSMIMLQYSTLGVSVPSTKSTKSSRRDDDKCSDRKAVVVRKLRPKVEYGHVVSEVSVLLPKDIHSSQKSLQISCPINITCGDLKQRIEGVLSIPMTDYVVIFLGEILSDNDYLPSDAFESLAPPPEDSDDEIFRPRLYIHKIDKVVEEEEQPDNNRRLYDDQSESASSLLLQEGGGAPEAFMPLLQREARKPRKKWLPSSDFNITESLTSINCEHFAEMLIAEGYGDEGSFALLSDEILRSAPFWIPRGSRVRITTLARSVQEHLIAQEKEKEAKRLAEKAEQAAAVEEIVHMRMLDGDTSGQQYDKLIDIKRAWERKVREEEKQEQNFHAFFTDGFTALDDVHNRMRGRSRKQKSLSADIRSLISNCERKVTRDDTGCLKTAHIDIPETNIVCCELHIKDCAEHREIAFETNLRSLEASLKVTCNKLDYYKNGFISRQCLAIILRDHLAKYRCAMSDEDADCLLDECLMDGEEQKLHRVWAPETVKQACVSDIPVASYSIASFVKVVSHRMATLLEKKMLRGASRDY